MTHDSPADPQPTSGTGGDSSGPQIGDPVICGSGEEGHYRVHRCTPACVDPIASVLPLTRRTTPRTHILATGPHEVARIYRSAEEMRGVNIIGGDTVVVVAATEEMMGQLRFMDRSSAPESVQWLYAVPAGQTAPGEGTGPQDWVTARADSTIPEEVFEAADKLARYDDLLGEVTLLRRGAAEQAGSALRAALDSPAVPEGESMEIEAPDPVPVFIPVVLMWADELGQISRYHLTDDQSRLNFNDRTVIERRVMATRLRTIAESLEAVRS